MLLERKHELARLGTFSDAVVAFALTLLVVSLEVPRNFDQLRERRRRAFAQELLREAAATV